MKHVATDKLTWIGFKEAADIVTTLAPASPQIISLAADMPQLLEMIPMAPHRQMADGGPPGETLAWYARVGARLLLLECCVQPHINRAEALISTNYIPSQDWRGDWAVLHELHVLPSSIHVMRPYFISSRHVLSEHVLYRRNMQGWDDVAYNAKSREEAEELLAFLKRDSWNCSCYVGGSEPAGTWATLQDDEVISGPSSRFNLALRFACGWSLRYESRVFIVKDTSERNKTIYYISGGHVLNPVEYKQRDGGIE